MSKPTDYIGCHYYGFAYPSLVISHTSGVSSHACRSKFDPGTLVIVCAQGEDRNIYGFIGTALEVLTDKKPSDYWPVVKMNAAPVTKLKVLTPITLIPETVFSKMTQGGLMNVERSAVAQYIREYHNVITPVPQPAVENTPPPSEAPREIPKPAVVDGKIGYVYVIENLQAQGFKIGITDNIHRRFRQLEVGTDKANFIGYWSSQNYKNLEKFLHTQFEPERVPQSEWFILDDAQLDWTCDWLDENASQVKCKLDSFESKVLPSWLVRTWFQVKEWFSRTLTFA